MITKHLKESILSKIFKKKQAKSTFEPLTDEHRDLIRKHFPRNTNVNEKYGHGEYVLPYNVHGGHNLSSFSFRNESGKLRVSVAHHASKSDRLNPKAMPLFHSDHEINNDSDMEKVKDQM